MRPTETVVIEIFHVMLQKYEIVPQQFIPDKNKKKTRCNRIKSISALETKIGKI